MGAYITYVQQDLGSSSNKARLRALLGMALMSQAPGVCAVCTTKQWVNQSVGPELLGVGPGICEYSFGASPKNRKEREGKEAGKAVI